MSLFISVRLRHFLLITTERSRLIQEEGYRRRRWHARRAMSPICPPSLDAAWVTPDRASTGKWAGSCRRPTPFFSFSFLVFPFLFGSNVGTLRGMCTCTPGVSGENTYLCNHAHRSQGRLGELLCHQSREFMIEGGIINTGKEVLHVQIHVFFSLICLSNWLPMALTDCCDHAGLGDGWGVHDQIPGSCSKSRRLAQ